VLGCCSSIDLHEDLVEMKIPGSENVRWFALIGGLVATMGLLVFLQYRSVKAVSTTMREQMRANLRGSLMDVRGAFERELRLLFRDLQAGPVPQGEDSLHEVALRFENWRTGTAHPSLVAAIYVWDPSRKPDSDIVKLNASGTAFESVGWPENLIRLKTRLAEMLDQPGPPEGDDSPHGPVDHRPDGPRRLSAWLVDQDVPALVHLIYPRSLRRGQRRDDFSIQWIIVVLDRTVLGQHVFSELVERYFGTNQEASYEIAVIDRNGRAPDLYLSDPKLEKLKFQAPDATLNLFGRPVPSLAPEEASTGSMFVPLAPNPGSGPVHRRGSARGPDVYPEEGPPSLRVQPIHYALGQEWEIVAKNRLGSVDAAVAALSRRNLAFNLGVLAVLAATMAMIIAASLRARRFGQLQMDFVANVSHELRTPLTGIVSAAQNMADGLVDDSQKIAIYGKAIVQQAQQLAELVEQILQFSAIQKNGDRYQIQPVDIAEAVQFALNNTSALIQSAGFKVEQRIEPGLPPVSGDFKALSRCLQNLIGNAVKYGGDQRWMAIRAWVANKSNNQLEMCISVIDRGIGIRPSDLDHIFEPFYRTTEVTETQIHGTGLGLPLAKRIVEAMGGRITVTSEVGKGTTFTVHLPVR
jgi:signal transduction histidine kinase